MDQFSHFTAEKEEVIASLNSLNTTIKKLEDFGLDVGEDFQKISTAIKNIQDDILRIALVGAFSDGKTSVIAGWLGAIMPNMKIATDECSNAVVMYRPDNLPDKCEIVDTPGLFGDKKTELDDSEKSIYYSDITKKYISEAHLIFYIVDATNPLKDSHKETVKWLLRDLNKLSSTVFVINKMDEVADLRDISDFENQSKIKKDNVLTKLQRFVDLSDKEKEVINIVCISSNPSNRGLDFWFDKKDIYEERSRMGELKEVTKAIIERTTRDVLVRKTGADVIRELVVNKLREAENEFAQIELFTSNKNMEIERIEHSIQEGRSVIISAKSDLINELFDMEKRLLGQVRTLEADQILGFLEDEIGYDKDDVGFKLKLKIESSCEKCFQISTNLMSGIKKSIEKEIDSSEHYIASISSSALKASSKALGTLSKLPIATIKNGVFVARDTLGKVTGFVFKFKPWGATKLAANIGRYAGPVGAGITVVMDTVGTINKHRAEKKLNSMRTDITGLIKEHFKVMTDILSNNAKVFECFAPQIAEFEKILTDQRQALQDISNRRALLLSIQNEFAANSPNLGVIEGEFTVQ